MFSWGDFKATAQKTETGWKTNMEWFQMCKRSERSKRSQCFAAHWNKGRSSSRILSRKQPLLVYERRRNKIYTIVQGCVFICAICELLSFRLPEGNSFCFDNSFLPCAYPRIKNGPWSLGWTFNRATIIYRGFLLRAQFPFRCQVNAKFSLWRNLLKTFFAKKKKESSKSLI